MSSKQLSSLLIRPHPITIKTTLFNLSTPGQFFIWVGFAQLHSCNVSSYITHVRSIEHLSNPIPKSCLAISKMTTNANHLSRLLPSTQNLNKFWSKSLQQQPNPKQQPPTPPYSIIRQHYSPLIDVATQTQLFQNKTPWKPIHKPLSFFVHTEPNLTLVVSHRRTVRVDKDFFYMKESPLSISHPSAAPISDQISLVVKKRRIVSSLAQISRLDSNSLVKR